MYLILLDTNINPINNSFQEINNDFKKIKNEDIQNLILKKRQSYRFILCSRKENERNIQQREKKYCKFKGSNNQIK